MSLLIVGMDVTIVNVALPAIQKDLLAAGGTAVDSGSIGVAVSGSVVVVSHARGTDFTTATHAIWWVMTASGAAVLVLGFASNTAWARGSKERVAHLFEESH